MRFKTVLFSVSNFRSFKPDGKEATLCVLTLFFSVSNFRSFKPNGMEAILCVLTLFYQYQIFAALNRMERKLLYAF